ncbi:MAG: bifunctional 5,10-methylenetetrahydrofolate dehydrogenase/5,10-methenyltetrahydrofolate cyclohydrolase [bacterium]|nr:bifunctional 5,10-methylenetetrahydrofolate dehydrogenase/5,10-methenyltetrahydrofolate cyclohydrolase [bacterium]
MVIDGKKIADGIIKELRDKKKELPVGRYLAALLVGHDPDSVSFVKIKEQTAKKIGLNFRLYHILPEKFKKLITNDFLRKEVHKIAKPKNCGGLLVQLPLPENINKHYPLNAIPPEKDIDVLGERSLGACYNNRFPIRQPATETVEEILRQLNLKTEDLKIAIVGLGFLIGQPTALWLTGRTKELYLLDKKSDLNILKNADVIISGVGQAGLIKPAMLKNNAVVIDFGWDSLNGKIAGDFDYSEIINDNPKQITYTPTPGGTGPILVAKLFENFYKLNRKGL